MTTTADLDELALALPQTTKGVSGDGRPAYLVHGTCFCCQHKRGRDAIDPQTGERLGDVLMFRVADARAVFSTKTHFDGYPAVLWCGPPTWRGSIETSCRTWWPRRG